MTRKKIVLLVFSIVILTYFALNQVNRLEYLQGTKKILPYPSVFTIDADIYYANDQDLLEAEKRTIVVEGNNLVEAIVKALKSDPAKLGCYSLINDDVEVLSAKVVKQKLYLDLSKSYVDSNYWKYGNQTLAVYALVNSVTQFDKIQKVQIEIEGKSIYHYMTKRNDYSDFTFNDEINYKKPDSPEKVVLSFLNMISLGRYDAAYHMLENDDTASREAIIEQMKTYRYAKKSCEILKPFSRKNGEITDVYIRYQYFDKNRDVSYDGGTRIWQLREKPDGTFSIIWPTD